MFIVHVTPLTRGRAPGRLSYYTADAYPVGTVIAVPLRNREVPALVIEREDARAIKALLRTNRYETRKIRKQRAQQLFTPAFIDAARNAADYFVTQTGVLINQFTPTAVTDYARDGKLDTSSIQIHDSSDGDGYETLTLQLPRDERVEKYKTVIRSTFARGKSVFLLVPTAREAHRLKKHYEHGIEQYTYVLDSGRTKKQQAQTWLDAAAEDHPVLIIATPTFLSIPRTDFGLFLVEREMASSYKQVPRPHADARILVQYLARALGATHIIADTVLGLRAQRDLVSGTINEFEEHTRRLRAHNTVRVIDIATVRTRAKESKSPFPVLAPDSIACIKAALKRGGRAFVFAARRGIAAQTVCNDCGTTVLCAHCHAPVVLHTKDDVRTFLCHRCGSARDAHERCSTCDSWNLAPLGVGIERVAAALDGHFPDATRFVISSDETPTPKQAAERAMEFAETPGAILVGTEMAFGYLESHVDCAVMSSIDSLLCVPDFRIEEKLFGIILGLKERTNDALLVETTNPDNAMLKYAMKGSIAEYAREELALREQLRYPPYSTLIKVTCSGTKQAVIRDMQRFVDLVTDYTPRVFSGFFSRGRTQELHALLRIPDGKWPDDHLVSILRELPPSFDVDVDPERPL